MAKSIEGVWRLCEKEILDTTRKEESYLEVQEAIPKPTLQNLERK